MIFVTVGTQLPFDRLVKWMDDWAGRNPDRKVFAQIGPSSYVPKNIDYADFVTPARSKELVGKSELVVSHAGMGSILTALTTRVPLVMVPRRAALGEHRNDHQLATAERIGGRAGLAVALEVEQLEGILSSESMAVNLEISSVASTEFTKRLRDFMALDVI